MQSCFMKLYSAYYDCLDSVDLPWRSAGLQYCSSYTDATMVYAGLAQIHVQSVMEQPLSAVAILQPDCYQNLSVVVETLWGSREITAQLERFPKPKAFVPPTGSHIWIEIVKMPTFWYSLF